MRVWPVATAGRLGAYSYDPATRSFALVATSSGRNRRGDHRTDTIVFIPSSRKGEVRVTGAAASTRWRPGSTEPVRLRDDVDALAHPEQPDTRDLVTVGPAPAALTARVVAEADNPLQPIAEPAARAQAVSALAAAASSPNASIRSTAQLVQGLADIVLGSSDPNGAAAP